MDNLLRCMVVYWGIRLEKGSRIDPVSKKPIA
jgi:hypothetical protein